jgi:hypothetical protein
MMGTWFWINVPLMVLAFALTTGLSYALLLRTRRPAKPAAAAATPGVAMTPAATAPYTVRTRPAAA